MIPFLRSRIAASIGLMLALGATLPALAQPLSLQYARQFPGFNMNLVGDSTGTYVLTAQGIGGVAVVFLTKFETASGNVVWSKQLYTSSSVSILIPAISMDLTGIYAAITDGLSVGRIPHLFKVNRNGDLLFDRVLATSDLSEYAPATTTFGNNVYVHSHGSSGRFVYKLDQSGGIVWKRPIPAQIIAGRMAVDSTGIYLCGGFGLQKLDLDANPVWNKSFGFVNALILHPTGVYVGGHEGGTVNLGFVRRFDTTTGNLVWERLLSSTTFAIPNIVVEAGAADSTGILVAGTAWAPLPGQISFGKQDIFTQKYSFDGVLQWTSVIGTSESDGVGDAALIDGGLMITGHTFGTFAGNTANPALLARLSLPPPPSPSLAALLSGFPGGAPNGLSGKANALCNQLASFLNDVRAQRGKSLSAAEADILIAKIAEIGGLVGCPL
jgi:hypothetical protein